MFDTLIVVNQQANHYYFHYILFIDELTTKLKLAIYYLHYVLNTIRSYLL